LTVHAGLLIGECLLVNIKRKALQLFQILTRCYLFLNEDRSFPSRYLSWSHR